MANGHDEIDKWIADHEGGNKEYQEGGKVIPEDNLVNYQDGGFVDTDEARKERASKMASVDPFAGGKHDSSLYAGKQGKISAIDEALKNYNPTKMTGKSLKAIKELKDLGADMKAIMKTKAWKKEEGGMIEKYGKGGKVKENSMKRQYGIPKGKKGSHTYYDASLGEYLSVREAKKKRRKKFRAEKKKINKEKRETLSKVKPKGAYETYEGKLQQKTKIKQKSMKKIIQKRQELRKALGKRVWFGKNKTKKSK